MKIRPCKVTVRLTCREKEHLQKQARLAGMKMEPFLRALLDGTQITEHPPEEWALLVRQLAGIGNNINQIAHMANATKTVAPETIEQVQRMQSEIWRKVKGL